MPPKKATTSKKQQTKLSASAADAAKLTNNDGEKMKIEDLSTEAENLPNGSALQEEESVKDKIKPKSTKRASGRAKNVANELETGAPAAAVKKPSAKGRGGGKKKSNENEVIENEVDAASVSQEAEEETTAKANDEVEEEQDVAKKPKGRGGGGKKAEPKAKKTAKTKESKQAESVQEDEATSPSEEVEKPEKKIKAKSSNKKKKQEEEVEVKQEVEEEMALENVEKASKKSSRSSKKTENLPADSEPPKKKGRGSNKKESVPQKDEKEKTDAEVEVKPEIKEKKPTKRGRGGASKTVVTAEEEETPANGETEEVLPKKRSRKAASVEKEIVTEKPKRGRAKKADKLEKLVEEPASTEKNKEENEISNGQVKQEKMVEEEESPSSSNNKAETPAETTAPAAATTTKARGGRKRAATSANKKKPTKPAADDDNNVDDEDVDNTELEDDAVDGSKSSKTKKSKTDSAPLNATETKYVKEDFDLPPPKEGQTVEEPRFNLKISSWNVAGLRSWLKKEGLKYLEYEEPDIFCMQETKCTTDQLPEEVVRIPGYHPYWLCMPGGYAGVAIYSKIMPINVEYGIGNKEFDDCGRIITAEYEKFFLINVYVPNSGRKLVNLEPRMRWEKLFQEFVQKLDSRKPVVICGDMNVSHQEHDLANPKTNTRNAGFTKEERDKMTELLALGYVDTFRHLYPDKKGAYTFWTYMGNARARNVGWRLDYFIVSERFLKRVVDNCIRSQCKGSDHCPITLFLKL
ncbi:recombination repair protein 1 isoform X2 [Lucilia sericata]|uniref:recombination repair protein 1 isoform X2 n=1 Tax=Lucilia sericata TaxID=13632 RepID=UPI0018A827DC|nr:recombination repair protein 1 isoform X2 [Lucilia sericata]